MPLTTPSQSHLSLVKISLDIPLWYLFITLFPLFLLFGFILFYVFEYHYIWAIGRSPRTDLGLDKVGVEMTKEGYIKVDEFQNTSYVSFLSSSPFYALLSHNHTLLNPTITPISLSLSSTPSIYSRNKTEHQAYTQWVMSLVTSSSLQWLLLQVNSSFFFFLFFLSFFLFFVLFIKYHFRIYSIVLLLLIPSYLFSLLGRRLSERLFAKKQESK